MPIDRARIYENGWAQGSFFTRRDSTRLLGRHGRRVRSRCDRPVTALILASHICDVLSHIGEDEPDATVYPVMEIQETVQFNASSIRRPRVWHFEMDIDGQTVRRELLACTGFAVPRINLETLAPWQSAKLGARYAREFPKWLAIRWNRPAFPDAFNERLRDVQSEIKKEIKNIAPLVNAVLIYIEPFEEISQDDPTPYEVEMCILMQHAHFEDDQLRQKVQSALNRIVATLRDCKLADGSPAFFIAEGKCVARSMAQMSVAEYSDFSSFGFEELSLRDGADLPSAAI